MRMKIRITAATAAMAIANNAASVPQPPHAYHEDDVRVARACAIAAVIQSYKPMSADDLQSALCIANYESKFRARAVAENKDESGNLMSADWGVFQINDVWQMPDKKKPNCYAMYINKNLRVDPVVNSKCAAEIFDIVGTFHPWSAWKQYCSKEDYRQIVQCDGVVTKNAFGRGKVYPELTKENFAWND